MAITQNSEVLVDDSGSPVQGQVSITGDSNLRDASTQPLSLDQFGSLRVSASNDPSVFETINDSLFNSPWIDGESSSIFDVGNDIVNAKMWED